MGAEPWRIPRTNAAFVPAASVTIAPEIWPDTFPMPAVDAGNRDVVIRNGGMTPAWLSFAADAPVGPDTPGCVTVPGGAIMLLSETAAVVDAALSLLVQSAQGGAYGTAAAVSVWQTQHNATLTITRGTACIGQTF